MACTKCGKRMQNLACEKCLEMPDLVYDEQFEAALKELAKGILKAVIFQDVVPSSTFGLLKDIFDYLDDSELYFLSRLEVRHGKVEAWNMFMQALQFIPDAVESEVEPGGITFIENTEFR